MFFSSLVVQLVEHCIVNAKVAGSWPAEGATKTKIKTMFKKQPLDDENPYTAGWTRSKMMKALQETLPYLADDEIQSISSQIHAIQKNRTEVQRKHKLGIEPPVMRAESAPHERTREKVQEYKPLPRNSGWTPPGPCMNTNKEENRKMREKIAMYTQGDIDNRK